MFFFLGFVVVVQAQGGGWGLVASDNPVQCALLLLVRLKNSIADAARARRSHGQKQQPNQSGLRLLRKAQGWTKEHQPLANSPPRTSWVRGAPRSCVATEGC